MLTNKKQIVLFIIIIASFYLTGIRLATGYSFLAGDYVGNVHYHGGGFIGTDPVSPNNLNITVSLSENFPPYNVTFVSSQYGQGIYYLTWINTTITTLITGPFNFTLDAGIEWLKALW